MAERKPIGYVEATVRFPIYEGDEVEHLPDAEWYEYSEPGVKGDHLAVCRRECKLQGQAKVVLFNESDKK